MTNDKPKRPPWRPSEYDPAYCERVVDAGKQGKSITWMAGDIGVHVDTIYEWEKVHPDFSDALKLARVYSQSWWEDVGQSHIINEPQGPTVNASLYAKSMAARFPADWRDNSKVEHTGPGGGAIQTETTVKLTPQEAYKLMLEGK